MAFFTKMNSYALPILLLMAMESYAKISVMYAHERTSDLAAEQCLMEMYPSGKRTSLQESDKACIIFCVLKKLKIMDGNGAILLENYRKRFKTAHQLERGGLSPTFGNNCMETAEAAVHKEDVCRKAKVFNDCTHLYTILL